MHKESSTIPSYNLLQEPKITLSKEQTSLTFSNHGIIEPILQPDFSSEAHFSTMQELWGKWTILRGSLIESLAVKRDGRRSRFNRPQRFDKIDTAKRRNQTQPKRKIQTDKARGRSKITN